MSIVGFLLMGVLGVLTDHFTPTKIGPESEVAEIVRTTHYILFGSMQGDTNHAPVLSPISPVIVNEGDTVVFSPTATDGDTRTYSYRGWMTSSRRTANYTDSGTHTVTVTVSDGILSDSQDVMITVIKVRPKHSSVTEEPGLESEVNIE